VKKLDLFDSSPKFIHIHTINVGIKISSKNGLEKQFIHFDSLFNTDVQINVQIIVK
jgi:hypothetical protein